MRQTEWTGNTRRNGWKARYVAGLGLASRTSNGENSSMATPASRPADGLARRFSRRLRHVFRRLAVRLALVMMVAGLGACSALKSTYEQGDHLAYWWLDRYVDISSDQAPQVRSAIATFFRWHRREQLPAIAALLEQAKGHIQQPMAAQTVRHYQQEAQRLGHLAFRQALPDTAALLVTLTPAQIRHMQERMASDNAKYRRTFLAADEAERIDARMKKVMRYAELMYGDFTAEQERQIRIAVAAVVRTTAERLALRERRQQAWLALAREVVTERPERSEVVRRLERFDATWREQANQSDSDAGIQLAVQIANLTTPAQRQHAVKRLQGWLDDTQALMRRS